MMVTLTGVNDFLRKAELSKLVAAFAGEHTDMAIERFDGEEADAARMQESVSSLPFLSARKLVILYEPGKQKAFAEKIGDILGGAAETTDLIIIEPKLDKRLTYYKTLKKQTDFREFGDLDAGGLATWAAAYCKEQGGTLSAADARFLIDRVGPNQQLLKQELDKLLNYDPQIGKANIEALTEPTPQSTVFELLDAAFSGNTARTLQLYHEQRTLKVEPQAIIAMLAWQLHVLALIKTAAQRSVDEIAREAKLNPFVVRKSQGLARSLDVPRLKGMIHRLLQLDLDLKTRSLDADEATLFFLTKLANR